MLESAMLIARKNTVGAMLESAMLIARKNTVGAMLESAMLIARKDTFCRFRRKVTQYTMQMAIYFLFVPNYSYFSIGNQ